MIAGFAGLQFASCFRILRFKNLSCWFLFSLKNKIIFIKRNNASASISSSMLSQYWHVSFFLAGYLPQCCKMLCRMLGKKSQQQSHPAVNNATMPNSMRYAHWNNSGINVMEGVPTYFWILELRSSLQERMCYSTIINVARTPWLGSSISPRENLLQTFCWTDMVSNCLLNVYFHIPRWEHLSASSKKFIFAIEQ